jgi:hypothetical protein
VDLLLVWPLLVGVSVVGAWRVMIARADAEARAKSGRHTGH